VWVTVIWILFYIDKTFSGSIRRSFPTLSQPDGEKVSTKCVKRQT
jgi:hypothetical protein